MEFPNNNPNIALRQMANTTKISTRPVKMVFTNRVRGKGLGQWQDRALAAEMCRQLETCEVKSFHKSVFAREIRQYAFLLCVHGGGIDPNPNLFQALIAGVIPIIAPFPAQSMYDDLPVLITDGNWTNINSTYFSRKFLAAKMEEFAPYFEDENKRAHVLERLTMQYWWGKVEASLRV